jgi:hypothetical protein
VSYTRNDTGPALLCTLTCTPPQTFLGATAVAHIRKPSRTVLTKTPSFNTTTGVATVSWAAGDLDEWGNYAVEVQLTYASGVIQTFGVAAFYVADELG